MNYNAVISVRDVTDESGEIVEPVTLTEMKNYLRLMGFVDADESPSTDLADFDFDDGLLGEMITAARQLFEEKTGQSIVFHSWEAWVNNSCTMQEIPYGPVIGDPVVKDRDGNVLTSTFSGNLWKYLKSPAYKELILTYDAGYGDTLTTPLPKAIKIDIMRLVAYMYENRGNDPKIEEFCSQMVSKYSRNTPIL